MNLENIMHSKISQIKKVQILYEFTCMRYQLLGGGGIGNYCLMWTEVSVGEDGKDLENESGDSCKRV